MSGEHTLKAVRGSFIDVTRTVDNPEEIASALRFIEDGLLLIKQGKVEWFGEWENGKHQIPDTIRVRDYRGRSEEHTSNSSHSTSSRMPSSA